jgi:hypothetical protein
MQMGGIRKPEPVAAVFALRFHLPQWVGVMVRVKVRVIGIWIWIG